MSVWVGRLRGLVVALAIAWAVVMVVVFASRIGFPLELEWMEGGSLHTALRLQQGQSIYPEPSAEFVPFLYTPLYPAVLAVLGWVLPLGYVLGRAVSIAAVGAVAAGLWRLVRFEGKPRAHAAAAVGLFLSGYVFTFRWYDVARADSFFLALLLWGLILLRESGGRVRRVIAAGTLVAASFWAKQTAAVFVLASGVGGLIVAPRLVWIYAATIAAIDGGGVLLGQWLTEGRLWTYIYKLHQSHAFNAVRFWRKTWGMFLHAAPFLLVLAGLVGGKIVADRACWREHVAAGRWRGPAYWGVMAAAGLLVSALGYSTQWAEPNAFMPGVCFASAWLAVMLPVGRGEAVALGLVAAQLVFALVIEPTYQPIQDRGLAGLKDSYVRQDLWRTIPPAALRARAAALRAELEGEPRPILALHRPWWSVLAGGPGHVGSMGIHDVPKDRQKEVEATLAAAVSRGEFAAIWVDGDPPAWLRGALRRRYAAGRQLAGDERVLPMTGYMSAAGMVTPWTGVQHEYVRKGE
ncbi:hypothetical protein [Nannocystis punicea]|uniref:Glycosyltransferase RgtA/B/C/D-like domain-containing protein n=1 Tax=Nannocystis punicea TaxID=2995304 RepID=A0ABY7H2K7_9BACT|nr:hypothetical protein [Nannocystis poenicansa]WAS93473.1 hypothetical protein O0S08_45645 [Nannocystis poenicansa]